MLQRVRRFSWSADATAKARKMSDKAMKWQQPGPLEIDSLSPTRTHSKQNSPLHPIVDHLHFPIFFFILRAPANFFLSHDQLDHRLN